MPLVGLGHRCCFSSSTWFLVRSFSDSCPHSNLSNLLTRLASDIIVSLHNPAGVSPTIAASGVEVRKGDYADPDSLRTAFAGADKLFLVSYPSIAHELRVRMHKNAISAAKAVGVKHIYYTSLAFGFGAQKELVPADERESVAAVMQAHLDTEAYIRASGLTYTVIREGIYSESWPLYFGFWSTTDTTDEAIIPHGDGAIAWASRVDLGEGTARILSAVRMNCNP